MLELLNNLGEIIEALLELFVMAPLTCIVVVAGCIVIFLFAKDSFKWMNAGFPDEWPPKK